MCSASLMKLNYNTGRLILRINRQIDFASAVKSVQIVVSTFAKLSLGVASSSLMHRAVLTSLNLSTIQVVRARSA